MMGAGAVRHPLHIGLAADVAGVDAQLRYAVLHGADGQAVIKMDVRHQGHGAAVHQRAHGFDAVRIIDRHAHDVAARRRQRLDLRQGGRHVPGVGIGHALHGYGRAAAQRQAAHRQCSCFHGFSCQPKMFNTSWKVKYSITHIRKA